MVRRQTPRKAGPEPREASIPRRGAFDNLIPILSNLPHPSRLVSLVIFEDYEDWAIPKEYSAAFVEQLTASRGLKYLEINFPCDLADLHGALQSPSSSLTHVKLGYSTKDNLRSANILPLVSGAGRLPSLEELNLSFVRDHNEDGLTDWPLQFGRKEVEYIVSSPRSRLLGRLWRRRRGKTQRGDGTKSMRKLRRRELLR